MCSFLMENKNNMTLYPKLHEGTPLGEIGMCDCTLSSIAIKEFVTAMDWCHQQ